MSYYVYILSNQAHTLYIGFTNDLPRRIYQHRTGFFRTAFTARYTFNRLVYYEVLGTADDAMRRERPLSELIDQSSRRRG